MIEAPAHLVQNFIVDPFFGTHTYDLPYEGTYVKCIYTHQGRLVNESGLFFNGYPSFYKDVEYEVIARDSYRMHVKLRDMSNGDANLMNWKKEGCNFVVISTEQQRAVARLNAAHKQAMIDMKKADEERRRKDAEERRKREQDTLAYFDKIQKIQQENEAKMREEAQEREKLMHERMEKAKADSMEEKKQLRERFEADQSLLMQKLEKAEADRVEEQKKIREKYEADQATLREEFAEQRKRASEEKMEMIRLHKESEEKARKQAIELEMKHLCTQFQTYKKNQSLLQAVVFVLNRGADVNQVKEIETLDAVDLLEILQENSLEDLRKAWIRRDQLLMEWYYPKPPAYRFEGINWDDFNIVICGSSGVGKSSCTQAILRACGVAEELIRKVATGEKETTMEETGYELAPRFMLWDMPGGGTQQFEEGDEGELYIRSQYLAHFDLVLCVSATRMRTCEVYAYQKLTSLGRNVVWIRNKVDQDVKNRKEALINADKWEEAEKAEEDILEQARKECAAKGIKKRSDLFLVGRKMNMKKRRFDMLFDFYRLLERIKLSGIAKIGNEDLLNYEEPDEEPDSEEGEEEIIARDDEDHRRWHQPGMNGGGRPEYQPEGRKRKKGLVLDVSMLTKGKKGLSKTKQVEGGSTKSATDAFLASLRSKIADTKDRFFDVDTFESKMNQKKMENSQPEFRRPSLDVNAFEKNMENKKKADQDLRSQSERASIENLQKLEKRRQERRRRSVQQVDFRSVLKKRRQHMAPME